MDLGLGRRDVLGCPTRIAIDGAHRRAAWERRYKLEALACILKNSQEYFACSSQAWAQLGNARVGWHGQNSGVTTRSAIKEHDPRAAAVLARIWGDGAWRPKRAQREHGLLPKLVARKALPALDNGIGVALSRIITAMFVGVVLMHSSSPPVRRLQYKVT